MAWIRLPGELRINSHQQDEMGQYAFRKSGEGNHKNAENTTYSEKDWQLYIDVAWDGAWDEDGGREGEGQKDEIVEVNVGTDGKRAWSLSLVGTLHRWSHVSSSFTVHPPSF